jgi:hypothetical protein
MGAEPLDPKGCTGQDILHLLNQVFGHANSPAYKKAQDNNQFGGIQATEDNYKDLIAAYKAAGVEVSDRWAAYLKVLGTVKTTDPMQGPQNIFNIAQTRHSCLTQGADMSTQVHVPQHGGHVHAKDCTINSPYPL